MSDTKGKLRNYFTLIYAALIILAAAIGAFIYSLVRTTPEDLAGESVYYTDEGMPAVNPSGASGPSSPPYVTPPTSPPPEN
ncbi:MAG: hypothetical protein ABIH78_03050 [Candidatus Peregrinibacteria bacterium]